MSHTDPYPSFTKGERIADGAMHIAGIAFATIGTALLVVWAQMRTGQGTDTDMATLVGVWVYGVAMTASFVASACYHFTPWETPRPVLRRIDHAAIYVKIAGTYTPLVVLIGSAFAYGILGLVWALAAIGVIAKLFFWARPSRWGVALYVAMGWLSVALLSSLVPLISGWALALMVIGGLIYSAGAILFSLDGMRYQNAIWHGFVLAASACFFVAIAMGVL